MTAALVAAIVLSAEPSRLTLGAGGHAAIRIQCPSAPLLTASTGTVGPAQERGPGEFEAEYRPPEDSVPQVAILSAVADGEVAWIAIPLFGQGDADVKTRRRAKIAVQIGDATFGPVVANESGRAVVHIVVPPGVHEARHGKTRIDLRVPPTRTVHAAPGRARVLADRTEVVPIWLVATTASGEARPSATFVLTPSRGSVGDPEARGPGLWRADWTLPPATPGEARLDVELGDARGFVARLTVPVDAGPARTIELRADRENIAAPEPRARVRASARDAAGNPSPEPLRFETTFGKIDASSDAPGEWSLSLAVPAAFEGRETVSVTAKGTEARAELPLGLAPGEPAQATISPPLFPPRADGRSSVRLAVSLLDRYGNPIQNVRPAFSAEHGRIEGDSRFASYVPPFLRDAGTDTIAVRAGAAEGRTRLSLRPDLRRAAAGAKAGVLTDLSGFSSPYAGVEVALRSDLFGPQFAASVELGYAFSSSSSNVVPTGGVQPVPVSSHVDLALLGAMLAVRAPLPQRIVAWAGAGPLLALEWSRVRAAGVALPHAFAAMPGAHLSLGAERRFGFGLPFADVRFGWTANPDAAVLKGPLRSITFALGVRFEAL